MFFSQEMRISGEANRPIVMSSRTATFAFCMINLQGSREYGGCRRDGGADKDPQARAHGRSRRAPMLAADVDAQKVQEGTRVDDIC